MSRISQFHGIRILMFFDEHGVPHFHAEYAGRWASFAIADGTLLAGSLPPRARRLVLQWWRRYKFSLSENWQRMRADLAPHRIPPLE